MSNNSQSSLIENETSKESELLTQAENLAEKHQWADVINSYKQALKINPDNARVYQGLGDAMMAQEMWEEAIAFYREAIAREADLFTAYHKQGDALIKLQRWEEAEATFKKALELKPNFHWLHYQLGEALAGQKRWEEAKETYGRCVEIKVDFLFGHQKFGKALLELQQWEEAEESFRKVLSLAPDYHWACYSLGEALVGQERWEEAVPSFEKAIELKPDLMFAYQKLGDVLLKLQRWEKAEEAFRKAIELTSDFCWSHYGLGEALRGQDGKEEKAAIAYQRAIELNPNFAWGYRRLGDVLADTKNFQEAKSCYERARELDNNLPVLNNQLDYVKRQEAQKYLESIRSEYLGSADSNGSGLQDYKRLWELLPKNVQLYQDIGHALSQIGQWQDAIESYQRSCELEPSNPDIYYHLGVALSKVDKWLEVYRCFEKITELEPDFWENNQTDFEIHHKLGDFFLRELLFAKAIESYKRAIALNPKFAWSYNNLGRTLSKLERYQEASDQFQKAIEVAPDLFWSYYYLGETLEKQGKIEEAKEAYDLALKLDRESAIAKQSSQKIFSSIQNKNPINQKDIPQLYDKNADSLVLDDGKIFDSKELYVLETYSEDPSGLGVVARLCSKLGKLVKDSRIVKGKVLVAGRPDLYHGLVSPSNTNYIWTTFESSKIPKSWVSTINQYFTTVFVPHQYVLQVFRESGVELPIKVLPLGYPAHKRLKTLSQKPDKLKLGILGVPTKRKNFEKVVAATQELQQQGYDLELMIHCPSLVYEEQKKWSELPGITLSQGNKSDTDIDRWYSELDAYIYPSSGEGWSFTPREAMSLGIPTIISDIPVHQELVESEYYLTINSEVWEPAYYEFLEDSCGEWKSYSVAQIQEAIKSLIENYQNWYDLAQKGKQWIVKRWRWGETEQKLLGDIFPSTETVLENIWEYIENHKPLSQKTKIDLPDEYKFYLTLSGIQK